MTKLFVGVAVEAAGVRADERDLKQLELQDPLNAIVKIFPRAEVVTKPVA